MMTTFNSLGLSEHLLKAVLDAGYSTPTEIQSQAIPAVLDGRDVIGCAQTGTGKTAAFVLPMLDRLASAPRDSRQRSVRALVVTPTRELASQVEQAITEYGRFTPFRSIAVYGGVGMHPQIKAFRRGVDIVVATPGRLLDHMNRGNVDLSEVEVLVLDEADRMMDMGFIHDIRKIVATVPKRRQTLLFSATMPREIEELGRSILHKPERIIVGSQTNPADTVIQQVCAVEQHHKMDLLLHVLENESVENVIVFTRTKHRADRVMRKLEKGGFAAAVMHSNRSQNQRQRALDNFKKGRTRILVATDIAARGIDVDNISHVINYDTPNQAEDYIHRIGRTGRAEASGDAITFVARDEVGYLRKIESHTGQQLLRKTYDGFKPDTSAPREESSRGRQGSRSRRSGSNGRRR